MRVTNHRVWRWGVKVLPALCLVILAIELASSVRLTWALDEPESAGLQVAGTQPFERPAGAPVVQEMEKDGGWYGKALTGVTQPYPESLRFLEDQGAWYTPFTRPGMSGPYDVRAWHKQ